MAALEAIFFFPSSQKSPLLSSPTPSSSLSRLTLFVSTPTPSLSLKFSISPQIHVPRKSQLYCSAVEEITVQETRNSETEPSENAKDRRKLFVANLPSSYYVDDIKKLFGECGTVTYVEELFERPITVKLSEKKTEKSGDEVGITFVEKSAVS